jgi:DNA polymerase IV
MPSQAESTIKAAIFGRGDTFFDGDADAWPNDDLREPVGLTCSDEIDIGLSRKRLCLESYIEANDEAVAQKKLGSLGRSNSTEGLSGPRTTAAHHSLFTGQRALFLPIDGGQSSVRNLRKSKFAANGGAVADAFDPGVTFLLCDDDLNASMILAALNFDQLPEHVVPMRHAWISECLVQVTVADCSKFAIEGFLLPQVPVAPSQSADISGTPDTPVSLIIKAQKGAPAIDVISLTPEGDESRSDDLTALIHQVQLGEASEEDQPQGGEARWQSYFKCMHAHAGPKQQDLCVNEALANALMELAALCDAMPEAHDKFRSLNYRKAAATIRRRRKSVTSSSARKLPHIGQNIAAKVDEFLTTGKIGKLELWRQKLQPVLFLTKIYGVGPVQAYKWYEQGLTTLDDVVARGNPSTNQRLGIQYFDNLQARIPRAEADEHLAIVKEAAERLDSELVVVCLGSYRRGALDCGDVDFLITKENASSEVLWPTFNALISSLVGYLTHPLLVSSSREDGKKWQGLCRIPGRSDAVQRRVDFLLVPWQERGAALIYFTGNDLFNRSVFSCSFLATTDTRSIRLLARKKGLCLSEKGLFSGIVRDRKGIKLTQGIRLPCDTEEDIFDYLRVPYRPPEHRNVG